MRFTHDQLEWESVRRGIEGQAELLETAPDNLYASVSSLLDGRPPGRLYFVGCGDSYFCGLAARLAAELLTGITCEPLESLEFSRYALRTAPADSWVVGVSNSGDVARTVESLKYARQAGLRTIGITYNADSRLARNADVVINYDYRHVGFGPGTMSYVASLLSLITVAIKVAEIRGRLDAGAAAQKLAELKAAGPVLRATIKAMDVPAKALAKTLADATPVFALGAGPNYATALFTMAKMIESARHNTVAQQLEEWAHEQFFVCGPGTVTMVYAPPGSSLNRAREQLEAIRDMGGTGVAVCESGDLQTASLADVVLPVVGNVAEELSPLVYLAAGELIAYHFAVHSHKVMLGFDDSRRKEVNFRQIFGSDIPETIEVAGRAS
ncbi:MAG TPA: SIS domain-containing protein [Streptosporangiaceae bacterium]|nr:SIS domain-containing protein [Streptosporangiaceae bacterium]